MTGAGLLLAGALLACEGSVPSGASNEVAEGRVAPPGGMAATDRGHAADGWPMFRGDVHLTGVAAASLPDELDLLWTFQAGTGIESTAAIADGTVFVGSMDGDLHAIDLATGTSRWTYKAADSIKSSPSVARGSVFFGDERGVFHAVDARTGEKRWVFQTDSGIVSSANVSDGKVLFGSYDNHLYSLSAADGALRWRVETEGFVHATPAVAELPGGAVAVSSGCDGFLRLVRVDDGREVRSVAMGGYVAASPAVRDGVAYLGTFQNTILAIDLAKGEIVWTYEADDRHFPYYASAAIRGDLLVVPGRDKRVHALRPETGERVWTFAARGRIDASPVIAGDRVFIGVTSGEVYALDLRTGRPVWQFETGSSIVASPSVAGGRLVIGTTDGLLYCFGKRS